ncbi:MAG: hypothetical protein U9N02_01235 [Campylobacterota bacterium]|nr:hypothetical protein [Campylobacterota bacterium]
MTEKNLVTYLKKSFFTGTFKTIVVTLSTIVLLPLIISKIGMENYGLISLTMILAGMVVVSDFGISKTVTLLIGEDKDKKNVNNIVINALAINFFMLFIIGIILYILVIVYRVPVLGSSLEIDIKLQNYIILIGFISLCIMLINNLLTAILEAYYLMHYINVGFMISSVCLNLYIYIFSSISDSLYLLLLAPSVAFLTVTIYSIAIVFLHTDIKFGRLSLSQIKSMLSISYKFLNISLVNGLVIPANKYFIIYLTGSTTILGLFDIGLKVAFIANSFLNSIAQPLFGVFSNINKDKEKIFKISKQVSAILFLLYFVGIVTFNFFGLDIVKIIDNSNIEVLYKITLVLLIGVSFTAVSEPFYRALLSTKRLKAALILKLLVPILNILFYFILFEFTEIDRFIYSHSIAVFLSSLITIIFYIITYRKELEKN